MKRLDIDSDVEKLLIQVLDLALKGGGFSAHGAVQALISKVYEVTDEKKE